jgi:hypothetical protein
VNIHVGEETFRFSVEIRPDQERLIEALLAKIDRAIAQALGEFIRNATSPEAVRTLTRLIAEGRLEEAARFAALYSEPVGLRIADAFRAAALFETRMLQGPAARVQPGSGGGGIRVPPSISALFDRMPRPSVSVTFDPGNPRAAESMRTLKDEFLQGFNQDSAEVMREVIAKGLDDGTGPREVARQMRDHVGLSRPQMNALTRYRQLLGELDGEALSSVTRDRRYDATIRRAIKDGKPLTAEQIDTYVDARRRKMIKARAEFIATNESASALNRGREEGMRQMIEGTGIDPAQVTKKWQSMRDGRVRHTHSVMDGQKVQGLDGVFLSPSGATLRYPRDPKAPLAETAGCRCYISHRLTRG